MKVLVSSCLLGEDVRYDGGNSSITTDSSFTFSQKELFMDVICDNDVYSFCPEVSGGLGTPRVVAELVSANKPFRVETIEEEDVTIPFLIGAKNALDICIDEDIKVALLKSKSPSCGNLNIYDGTFSNNLIEGQGLTAKLLEENGIKVFNETQLEDLTKFIESN